LNLPNFDIWHDVGIVEEMKGLGLNNIFLENNAPALTMMEKAYGVGRETRSFVLLLVEAGIGGGIAFVDKLYSGWRCFGQEIGHMSIDLNGHLCDCGRLGCVELFACEPRILAAARKHDPNIRRWKVFADRAAARNPYCGRSLAERARPPNCRSERD